MIKNIDSLIDKAAELKSKGLVEGQIAEELNISRETATWLLTHAESKETSKGPKDFSVDWSAIGKNAYRLRHVSQALADMLLERLDSPESEMDVVVGIALSGVPLASLVARDLEVDLAIYTPSKQRWSNESETEPRGNFSANFADIEDAECVIVDDVITSGRTLEETVTMLQERGAEPNAIAVLVDKKGIDEIAGVPVCSLFKVIRVN